MNAYWLKILNNEISAQTSQELLLYRLAAYQHCADSNGVDQEAKAKAFLHNTMLDQDEAKEIFAKKVTFWAEPEIICSLSDELIHAVVYKMDYVLDDKPHSLHEISFFEKDSDHSFKYSHAYDLSPAAGFSQKLIEISPIRQIGDPILHHPAKQVSDFSAEIIKEQIKIMEQRLYETGGVGIATNQCAEILQPLKIILSGVNYRNHEHVYNALSRYPTTLFPQMQCYINPEIISVGAEFEDFNEGCLSIRSQLRASIKRPKTVIIKYQDINGNSHEKEFTHSGARVMLHELDHICNGLVYFQHVVSELSLEQLEVLNHLGEKYLRKLGKDTQEERILPPEIVFIRDVEGKYTIDEKKVAEIFQHTSSETLEGILTIIKKAIFLQS